MTKQSIKTASYIIVALVVFAVLGYWNIPKNLPFSTMEDAVTAIVDLNGRLETEKPQWDAIERSYYDNISKFMERTEAYEDNIRLDLKIRDSLKEAEKGLTDDVQSIIIRRTMLRAVIMHLQQMLLPTVEPENKLSAHERGQRVDVLLKAVEQFAKEAGGRYPVVIHEAVAAWHAEMTQTKAQQVIDVIDGMIAREILDLLARHRQLQENMDENYRQLVVLQAEMRQLYHVLYSRHAKTEKDTAWKVLTLFTNKPLEFDADYVENAITSFFRKQLDLVQDNPQ
ncbi:MAG TPA: hypothetical protein PKW95_01260 [bacterium]|nr:hypothetical protein [bacterium]